MEPSTGFTPMFWELEGVLYKLIKAPEGSGAFVEVLDPRSGSFIRAPREEIATVILGEDLTEEKFISRAAAVIEGR